MTVLPRGAVLLGLLAVLAPAQYPDILYLKFNEGSGLGVLNWAPTPHTPAFEGGVGGVWTSGPPGLGGALDFAGLDRLLTGWPTNLNQSFTIECWMRVNAPLIPAVTPCGTGYVPSTCPLGRLWGDYSGGMGLFRCYIGFYNTGANHLGGGFNGTYGATGLQASSHSVLDGTWHHIALVYDQAAQTITSFVDGNVDQQATGVTVGASSPAANFCVGGQQTTADRFNGSIDEVRVWSAARTQAQIQAAMTAEIPETSIRAQFLAHRTSGPAHHIVRFTDHSVTPAPGGIQSRFWSFGDGSTSTAANPCHVYTTPGVYTVSLTVGDGVNTDTRTRMGYITVGPQALVVGSCGQQDLYVATTPPPASWWDGFTLVSLDVAAPPGSGPFLGIWPDIITWVGISYPAAPGNPFHFLNTGSPSLYPDAPLVFPPGTAAPLAGLTMDCVVVYRDAFGLLIGLTTVARATL
jgi:PKD repeat protein